MSKVTLKRLSAGVPISMVDLSRQADEFARTWHDDQIVIDGVNFGAIAQLDIYQALLQLVQDEKQSLWSRARLTNELKRSCLDWPVRHALARGWNLSSAINSNGLQRLDYLFIYDVFNRGMIDSILPVQETMRDHITEGLTFDIRVHRAVRERLGDDRVRLFPSQMPRDPVLVDSMHTDLRRQYHNIRHLVEEYCHTAWPGMASAVMALLDRFVNRYFRCLVGDYLRLQAYLEYTQPRAIGLASDSHRCSRTITLLAQQMKIPTLVVQHGATVGRSAYVPVYADRVAVWGTLSAEWFRANDVAAEKIIITGQPRTDRMVTHRRPHQPAANGRLRVMVATNPIGARANRHLIRIVGEATRHLFDNFDLAMKLHPGKDDREFFESETAPYPILRNIVQQTDLYVLLAQTDIVITTQSTVGIEALAFGCKLIEVKVDDIFTGIPYSEYECAWQVESSAELVRALIAARDGSQSWTQITRRAKRFVDDYLGRLDGRASERVAQQLTNLAQLSIASGINFPGTR